MNGGLLSKLEEGMVLQVPGQGIIQTGMQLGQLAPGTVLTLDPSQMMQLQALQSGSLVLSQIPHQGSTIISNCGEPLTVENQHYISLPLSVMGGAGVEHLVGAEHLGMMGGGEQQLLVRTQDGVGTVLLREGDHGMQIVPDLSEKTHNLVTGASHVQEVDSDVKHREDKFLVKSAFPKRKLGRPRKDAAEVQKPIGKGPFRCETCDNVFQTWAIFTKHTKSHESDRKHRCGVCGVSYNQDRNLRLHMAGHQKESPFLCPECGRTFSRLASLRSHLKVHQEDDDLVCSECGEEYETEAQLTAHKINHKNETKIEIARPLNLTTVSSSAEPVNIVEFSAEYTCKYCNQVFNGIKDYKKHMITHKKLKSSLGLIRRKKKVTTRDGYRCACKFCGKKFEKPSQIARHERIHTGDRPYKCDHPKCDKAFNQKCSLDTHKLKHSGKKPFPCDFCSLGFSQRGNLRAHINRVHNLPPSSGDVYQCGSCTCFFKKIGSLNAHVSRFHPDEPVGEELDHKIHQFPPSDDIAFANSDHGESDLSGGVDKEKRKAHADLLSQAIHTAMNTSSKLQQVDTTSNDDKKSEDKGQRGHIVLADKSADGKMRKHLIRVRNETKFPNVISKLFLCNFCPKEFKKPSDLLRHIRIHTNDKPYKCPHCSRAFTVKSTLTAHVKIHTGTSSRPCHICGKVFNSAAALRVHKKQHENPQQCTECQQSFLTPAALRSHLAINHNIIAENRPRSDEGPKVELQEPIIITNQGLVHALPRHSSVYNPSRTDLYDRNYRCEYCPAVFKKSSHLKQHTRSHTGERPFVCFKCNKQFLTRGSLNAHLRTHDGTKMYQCGECAMVFTTAGSVRRHMSTHQEERPYMCPYCQKTFKTNVNCKKHMKTHRSDLATQIQKGREERIHLAHPITTHIIQPGHVLQPEEDDHTSSLHLIQSKDGDHGSSLHLIQSKDVDHASSLHLIQSKESDHASSLHLIQSKESDHASSLHLIQSKDSDHASSLHLIQSKENVHAPSLHLIQSEEPTQILPNSEVSETGEVFQIEYRKEDVEENTGKEPEASYTGNATMYTADSSGTVTLQAGTHTTSFSLPPGPSSVPDQVHLSSSNILPVDNATDLIIPVQNIDEPIPDAVVTSMEKSLPTVTSVSTAGVLSLNPTDLGVDVSHLQLPQVGELDPASHVSAKSIDHSEPNPPHPATESPITQPEPEKDLTKPSGQAVPELEKAIQSVMDDDLGDPPRGGKIWKCGTCGDEFTNLPSMKQHLNMHREKMAVSPPVRRESHKCSICSDVFGTEQELRSHSATHNTDTRTYTCEVCSAHFSSSASFARHQHVHTEQPFKCGHEGCDESFRTIATLTKHNIQMHGGDPGESNVPKFKRNASHLKLSEEQTKALADTPLEQAKSLSEKLLLASVAEKQKSENQLEESDRISETHANQCDQCDKSFKKPSDLTRHIRTHTGEKPYICDLCERTFAVKSTLVTHQKVHVGGKTLTCHICNSQFGSKTSLKVHMRLHTGSTPYKCPECDESFRTPGSRKSHMASHKQKQTSSEPPAKEPDELIPLTISAESLTAALDAVSSAGAPLVGATVQLQLHGSGFESAMTQLQIDENLLQQLRKGQNININISQMQMNPPGQVGKGPGDDGVEGHQAGKGPELDIIPVESILPNNGNDELMLNKVDGSVPNEGDKDSGSHSAPPLHIQVSRANDSSLRPLGAIELPQAEPEDILPNARTDMLDSRTSMLVTTGGRNDAVLSTTASILGTTGPILGTTGPILGTTGPILGTTGPILGSRDTLLPSSVSLSDADLQYRVETDETGRILDIHPQLEKSREHGGRDQVEGAIIDLEVIEDTMEEDSNDVLDSAVLNSTGGVLEGGEELSLQLLNQMDISQVYICPWCDRVFRTEKDRIDHLLTGHGVEVKEDITVAEPHDEETGRTSKEPRSCSVCEKKFSKPSQLKRHMRIHTGERPFACLMCMKSFNQKNALQIHMKKHTGERPYICPFCQYAFTQKGNLKTHISRSHVNEAQEYMQDDQAGLLQDGPTLVTGGDTSGAVSIDVSDLFGQN